MATFGVKLASGMRAATTLFFEENLEKKSVQILVDSCCSQTMVLASEVEPRGVDADKFNVSMGIQQPISQLK